MGRTESVSLPLRGHDGHSAVRIEDMKSLTSRLLGPLADYASSLRFPYLLALTGGLFVVDLVAIDPIPGVDEAVLLLITVMLSRLKKRKPDRGQNQGSGEREEKA